MICKTCDATDPNDFYPTNKSRCKLCIKNKRPSNPRLLKAHLCKDCGCDDPQLFGSNSKSLCKKCSSAVNLQRYHTLSHEDKTAYKRRVWKWQDNHIILYRYRSAKLRATKKQIAFTITEQMLMDIWDSQKGLCYYSKLPMQLNRDDNRMSVSIDRLDNKEGYVDGNVVLCCSAINIMKNDLSVGEFQDFVSILYKNLIAS